MKRLLLDQGLPRSSAALLVREGWGAGHVPDVGMRRASDLDILDRAQIFRLLQRAGRKVRAMIVVTEQSPRIRRLPVGGP